MEGWILFNFITACVAFAANMRRFRRDNPRRWMRLAAALISAYIAVIYLLNILSVIPESEIRFYMRWIQGAIMVYLIAEAWNG